MPQIQPGSAGMAPTSVEQMPFPSWPQSGPASQPTSLPPGGGDWNDVDPASPTTVFQPQLVQQPPQAQQPLWLAGAPPQQAAPPQEFSPATPATAGAAFAAPAYRPGHVRLGFFASAACLVTAAIILLFVWFMATNMVVNSNGSSASLQNAVTATASHNGLATPQTSATASPSATALPGQSYIDQPQLASAVNAQTGQPTQVTTTFKTNQAIYVTFGLHPHGQAGAVCVYWYLNGNSVTNFAFPVRPYSQTGYSYAIYGQPGTGSVDLYWASTTQCTDRVLAQHVTFTVVTG
ncbi:hypothetical protein [Thermogemmatispora onikobensis]|uniref:hypothetical protein n=1 Tax=Thermogemmatispora onikobensis TaxID=732234 RepID=UPI000852D2AF|nr:hypothetical protein [Thermogemmatispora onikobensis]